LTKRPHNQTYKITIIIIVALFVVLQPDSLAGSILLSSRNERGMLVTDYAADNKVPLSKTAQYQAIQDDTTNLVCPGDISTYTDLNSCDALITSGLRIPDPKNEITSLTWQMQGATVDQSPTAGINQLSSYVFNEGTTIITYRGQTRTNHPISCSFTITVSDNQVPRLVYSPGDITVSNLPGECFARVSWTEPIVSDNCVSNDNLIIESSHSSGDDFLVGETEVTYRISDGLNETIHRFTVTVIDREAPELTAPEPIVIVCGEEVEDAFTSWEQFEEAGGKASDNCAIDYASFRYVSQTASDIRCPYVITRIYSISDVNGNVTTVKRYIQVTGEEPEEIQEEQEKSEVILKSGSGITTVTLSNIVITPVTCFGGSDGSISVDTTSDNGPITVITWSNAATNTLSISGLTAGDYYVDITDGNGLQNFGPFTVTEPSPLAVTATLLSPVSCYGGNDGEVDVTVTGGNGGGGFYPSTTSNLSAGDYTFYGYDQTFVCVDSVDITVPEPDELIASATVTSPILCNSGTGSVKITASGGTGALSYTFNSITNSTGIFAGVSAGTSYTWSVTDANGCGPVTGTIDVTEPPALTVSILSQTVTCFGQSTGTVTASAGGGTPPYSYSSDGTTFQSDSTLTALSAGNHTITVRDNNGCETTTVVNIAESDVFSPGSHNTANVEACPGYHPADLVVSGFTGKSPFTFQWYHNGVAVGGANSTTFDPGQLLTVGVHTFYCIVTDSCGFSASTATKTITIVDEPDISINNGGTYCEGDAITLTTTITGGTGSFDNFTWEQSLTGAAGSWTEITDSTNSSLSPSSASPGTMYYRVTLDPNVASCNNTSASVSVTINPIPTIDPIENDSLCHGEPYGGLTFSGTNVSRYEWTNDNTSIGLGAGGTLNSAPFTLPSFTAENYGTAPEVATITVTPVHTANSVDCYGTPETFTITVHQIVKPNVQITIGAGQSATICEGETVSFELSNFADLELDGYTPEYIWLLNGSPTDSIGMTFSSNTLQDGDYVTLVVTTDAPCPEPDTAFGYTMTVKPTVVPHIDITESDNDICEGTVVSFNATPFNQGSNPSYIWEISTDSSSWTTTGSNSTFFSVDTLTPGNRYFRVNLQSTAQCASPTDTVSEAVKIHVNAVVEPEVEILPDTNNVCPGTPIQFTANPTYGGVNPHYQWKRNGNDVGSNLPTYTSTSLADGDSVWVVMTSDTACASVNPVSSSKVYITIKPGEPAIPGTISGTTDVCAGNEYTYTVPAVGTVERYIWDTDGWTIVSDDSTNTITVTAGTSDAIISVYAENDCGMSAERTKTITVLDTSVAPTGINISNNNTCEGSAKTLSVAGGSLGDGAYWVWYINGCGVDSVGTGNSIIVDPAAGDTVTYYVLAKGDCNTTECVSEDVIVKPDTPQVPGTIYGIDSVCPGDTIDYYIEALEDVISYNWGLPSGWLIVSQNDTLLRVRTGNAGQNGNIRVTATNDCGTSTASTLPVVVNPGAPATPGAISGDTYLCTGSQVTYTISNVANAERYIWDTDGWSVVSNDSTTSVTVIAGNTDAIISVYAENDCERSSGTSTLAVTAEDNAALIKPDSIIGPTAICPTLSTHFYVNTPVTDADGYIWTFPPNWDIDFGDGTEDVTVTVKGTSNSGWVTVAAYNICDTTEADSIYVNVAADGYVYAGPDIYVCEGTVQVYMAGDVDGAIQNKQDWDWESVNYPEKTTGSPRWEYFRQPDELGTLFDFPDGINNPEGAPGPGDSIVIAIHSTVNVQGCGTLSDTMKIFILPRPVIDTFLTDTVCEGESATLEVHATPNTQVEYIIDLEDVGSVDIDESGIGYIVTEPLTGSVTYDLIRMQYLDASKNICIRAVAGKAVVVVNPLPEVDAGTDIIACTSDSMVILNGTVTGVSDGTWSGGAGTFYPNRDTVDAIYYPTVSEMNSGFLTLTLTSDDPEGPCGTVSDEVDITFDQSPTVSAGANDTICATGTAQLVGSYGGAADSATWTKTGDGSFDDDTKNTAVYTPGPNDIADGRVYLIFTTDNPSGNVCGAVSDTMLLTINPAPIVDAGDPQTICGTDTVFLNGSLSGSADSAIWSGGAGTFHDPKNLNAYYIPSAAEIADGFVDLTLTSNNPDGPCGPVSDVVNITINPEPLVDAGSDQTICAGSNIVLEGSISINGSPYSGTWSGGSNQFLPSPVTLNATYIPGPSDADSVILVLTSDDPGLPCGQVSDTMILYIDPVPSISVSPSFEMICADDTLFLQGTVDSGYYGTWTTNGVGKFYPTDTSRAAYYIPGNGDVFNDTVTIVYTSNDPAGPCGPVTDTMLLSVKERIQITTQPVNTGACALNPADLFVNAVGDDLIYQWYKVGTPDTALTNTANITGVDTDNLHFNSATSANAGEYYVEITSNVSCGTTISDTVSLNVDQEIQIVNLYNSDTVCVGEPVTFEIEAIPGGVLQFAWKFNGDTIPGAHGDTLYLPSVNQSDAGSYSVYITGLQGYTCADAESLPGTLEVIPEDTITPIDVERTFCLNSGVSVAYQLSGGATGATLYADSLSSGLLGEYVPNDNQFIISGTPQDQGFFPYSIITSGACVADTILDTITINAELVAPDITIDQPEICYLGDPGPVYINTPPQGGTGPFTYQWQESINGTTWDSVGTGTSYDPTGPLADTTYYRVIATDDGYPSCGSVTSVLVAIYPSDDEAPSFTVPTDKTRSCSSSTLPNSTGWPTNVYDACTPIADLDTLYFDHDTVYSGCNYTFMRTWQLTDLSFNTALDTQMITIIDTTPPTLFDRADNVTIGCDDSRDPDDLGWSVFTDNCDDSDSIIVSYYDEEIPGICDGQSVIHRYWIASDHCGNIDTASSYTTITISDVIPPVVLDEKDTILACAADLPMANEIPDFEIVEGCGSYTVYLVDEHSYGIEDVSGYCPYKVDRIWRIRDDCGNDVEFTQTYIITQEEDCTPCKACLYDNTYNWADLTGNADSTITFYDVVKRDKCCGTDTVQSERNYYCASFNIKLDPTAVGVEILVDHVTPPGQGWKVDCEDVDGGKVVCIDPGRFHLFTFCKSAASDEPQENDYTFRSISGIVEGTDIETREECDKILEVNGSFETITWTSVFPGNRGDYDHLLSGDSDTLKYFNAEIGSPPHIQYEVCGQYESEVCFTDVDGVVCDTLDVYVAEAIGLDISTIPDLMCEDDTIEVTPEITPPGIYNLEWYDGPNGTGTLLSTSESFIPLYSGTYSVIVTDTVTGLGCNVDTINFPMTFDYSGPTIKDSIEPLYLNCNDPNYDGIIEAWLDAPQAEYVNADGDIISTPVNNNYDLVGPVSMICGDSVQVAFSAFDQCSNDTIEYSYIIVIDTTRPVITPANDTVIDCISTDPDSDPTYQAWLENHAGALATDECDDTLTWTNNADSVLWSGDPANNQKTVTFTATDACGNYAQTSATFSIVDITPPVLHCPGDFADTIPSDSCSINRLTMDTVWAEDDCSIPELYYVITPPSGVAFDGYGQVSNIPFDVGISYVFYTATDDAGLTDTCSFTVEVKQIDIPDTLYQCPQEEWLAYADPDSCEAYMDLDSLYIISDPCNVFDSIWHDSPYGTDPQNADGWYPIGTTDFHWYIHNVSGVIESCPVRVVVVDTFKPEFDLCPDPVIDSVYNGGCDKISDQVQDPTWFEDCSPLALYYELTLPNDSIESDSGFVATDYSWPIGQTDVRYILIDTFDNKAYCDFYVLIKDTLEEGSDYKCPDSTYYEAFADDDCTAPITIGRPTIIDTCEAIDSVWHTSPIGTSNDPSGEYPIGHTQFYWLIRLYDSVDIDSCEINVIVKDTISPTFDFCPPDAIDSLTNNDCDKVLNLQDPVPDDDCSPPLSLYYELTLPNDSIVKDSGLASDYAWPPGQTDVRYILVDSAGNEGYCDFYVLIKTALEEGYAYDCPPGGEEWADRDSCGAWVTLQPPVIRDTCDAIDSVWHDSEIFVDSMNPSGFYDIGVTYFNWYIRERDGDTIQCLTEVIVHDYMPELTCPPDTTVFAIYNETYAILELPPPVFHDNCPDSTLIWDAWWEGNPVLTYGDTATSGINILTGPDTFNLGITYIEYTFTDQHGHDTSCTFTVTVEAAPEITCPPYDTFYADNNCEYWFYPGEATLVSGAQPIWWTWTITNPDGTTLSGTDTTTLSKTAPDPMFPDPHEYPFQLGVTNITWTAENRAGADTCWHEITVIDTTPPVIYQLDSLEDCMEEIQSAIYNASEDDLYYPDRPDYLYFEAGDTTLDLTVLDDYIDNCELNCEDSITWVIDFSPYTDQHGVNWPAQDSVYYGSGQISEYGSGMFFPGDGTYMGNIEHWVSYYATDCYGNTSLVGERKIIVTPRPKIIKLNTP